MGAWSVRLRPPGGKGPVGQGAMPSMESIDGNTDFGRIQRRNTHKIGKDNFNYYLFTQ
jgi:hypothetical protein